MILLLNILMKVYLNITGIIVTLTILQLHV
ncbi:hypothetical protein [African swine fever virus]|nr:hypothetical protein [African swine fever virus]